jgi:hypothetical protein
MMQTDTAYPVPDCRNANVCCAGTVQSMTYRNSPSTVLIAVRHLVDREGDAVQCYAIARFVKATTYAVR